VPANEAADAAGARKVVAKIVNTSGLVLEGQLYARDNRLTLYSSPLDTPERADQNRSLENQGINSVGHVVARYCNPFVGGLFLSSGALDSFQGGCFIIDHDQDLQEQVGLFYDFGKSGLWAGLTQRYDSGLVTDAGTKADVLSSPDTAYADPFIRYNEDPQRVKSRTVWSFSLGARLAKYRIPLELQVDLLNAFDEKGLYNFQSTFGGTHVIPPRTLAGRIKYLF
jgi:hypothetical protein